MLQKNSWKHGSLHDSTCLFHVHPLVLINPDFLWVYLHFRKLKIPRYFCAVGHAGRSQEELSKACRPNLGGVDPDVEARCCLVGICLRFGGRRWANAKLAKSSRKKHKFLGSMLVSSCCPAVGWWHRSRLRLIYKPGRLSWYQGALMITDVWASSNVGFTQSQKQNMQNRPRTVSDDFTTFCLGNGLQSWDWKGRPNLRVTFMDREILNLCWAVIHIASAIFLRISPKSSKLLSTSTVIGLQVIGVSKHQPLVSKAERELRAEIRRAQQLGKWIGHTSRGNGIVFGKQGVCSQNRQRNWNPPHIDNIFLIVHIYIYIYIFIFISMFMFMFYVYIY